MIMIVIGMVIAILVFLGILKLSNKFILKNTKKISIKQIIFGWLAVFAINLLCVMAKIPFALGMPVKPFFDGGANTFYCSLGYIIHVEQGDFVETPIVEFYVP